MINLRYRCLLWEERAKSIFTIKDDILTQTRTLKNSKEINRSLIISKPWEKIEIEINFSPPKDYHDDIEDILDTSLEGNIIEMEEVENQEQSQLNKTPVKSLKCHEKMLTESKLNNLSSKSQRNIPQESLNLKNLLKINRTVSTQEYSKFLDNSNRVIKDD